MCSYRIGHSVHTRSAQVNYSLEGWIWYVSYIDSTRGDDVTSSELVNGGTIHDTVSMKTMTLLGEGVAGVGRNVWSGEREYGYNKL